MDETTAPRPARPPRRGHDIHQTHFFYRDDLEAGATVVDHVTGQAVGEVSAVGRHVFEGYGAPAASGGPPGDLVVEVVELEPVVPVRMPWRDARPRPGLDPQGEETVSVELDRDDAPRERPARPSRPAAADREPAERETTENADGSEGDHRDRGTGRNEDGETPDEPTALLDAPAGRDRTALGASVAQGVAIAVLAPLLALALLVLLVVLFIG
ncbi:hypothetical protein ASG49_11090 [Marmoricola sp. Leaf446]|uniref:hypothetical protein n=1 Tax=Marmoricola sp. Leaf446 TaxID=1736379 RepID=UPI0006FCAE05|nr:hypothetical protein [Marmoricola sp. Leaf446]KQT91556.1 hypothetical protein ASG49_11090 [Marmoricola sp. Leaf446]